nr:uncharacterized protein CI109_005127 [Kwoniella shandongensis]KAA5526551.1 hypothetical protein CI109_005127 [Kwoniella shandongensis]
MGKKVKRLEIRGGGKDFMVTLGRGNEQVTEDNQQVRGEGEGEGSNSVLVVARSAWNPNLRHLPSPQIINSLLTNEEDEDRREPDDDEDDELYSEEGARSPTPHRATTSPDRSDADEDEEEEEEEEEEDVKNAHIRADGTAVNQLDSTLESLLNDTWSLMTERAYTISDDITILRSHNEELARIIERLRVENEDLGRKNRELEMKSRDLDDEKRILGRKNEELGAQLEFSQQECHKLQAKIEALEDGLQTVKTKAEEEKQTSRAQSALQGRKLDRLIESNRAKACQIVELSIVSNESSRLVEDLQGDLSKRNAANLKLEEEVMRTRESTRMQNEEIVALKAKLYAETSGFEDRWRWRQGQWEARLKKKDEEIDDLKHRLEAAKVESRSNLQQSLHTPMTPTEPSHATSAPALDLSTLDKKFLERIVEDVIQKRESGRNMSALSGCKSPDQGSCESPSLGKKRSFDQVE